MKDNVIGITHCSFYCNDYEKMVAFYRDTLGLEQLFTLRHPDGNPWLTYLKVAERQFVELFNIRYVGDNRREAFSFSHLAILVEDLAEAARTLEHKGIMLYHGPLSRGEVLRMPYMMTQPRPDACGFQTLWLQDPEKNEIVLMQHTPDSKRMLGEA